MYAGGGEVVCRRVSLCPNNRQITVCFKPVRGGATPASADACVQQSDGFFRRPLYCFSCSLSLISVLCFLLERNHHRHRNYCYGYGYGYYYL